MGKCLETSDITSFQSVSHVLGLLGPFQKKVMSSEQSFNIIMHVYAFCIKEGILHSVRQCLTCLCQKLSGFHTAYQIVLPSFLLRNITDKN